MILPFCLITEVIGISTHVRAENGKADAAEVERHVVPIDFLSGLEKVFDSVNSVNNFYL